ncbi:MAG: hypothetical protein NVS1B14_09580 [Vulcanimicrobiaceae bacterium]
MVHVADIGAPGMELVPAKFSFIVTPFRKRSRGVDTALHYGNTEANCLSNEGPGTGSGVATYVAGD